VLWSDLNDIRGTTMIGMALAIVCLFWGLGCLCRDIARWRVWGWVRQQAKTIAVSGLLLIAAGWLLIDMTPKAVRLYAAHRECGTWTAHCQHNWR
jgi:hypothetical protein